jgi:hypothetical protein
MDSLFLRRVLLADGLISGAAGAVMIAGASFIAPLTDLPQTLLIVAGVTLAPWTIALVALSRAATIPRTAVRAVIAVNAAWVIASVIAMIAVAPNLFGYAFVIAQALAVGLFAELQIVALKREPQTA